MTPSCDIAMTNTVTLGIQTGKSLSCFNKKIHESKYFNKKKQPGKPVAFCVKFSMPTTIRKKRLNIFRKKLYEEKKVVMFPYKNINGTKP